MIKYTKGDACETKFRPVVIAHIVNDCGKFASGFAAAVAKKWPNVQQAYFDWSKTISLRGNFYLGQIQVVKAEDGIAVANMIGQRDYGEGFHHIKPIRYEAVNECLYRLNLYLHQMQPKMMDRISVVFPRIGTLRAGGDWRIIEPLIIQNLINSGWDVYVYNYQEKDGNYTT